MNKTTIEWTDYTWNPVTGCTKVSQGCKNCYAETIANRFWGDRKFTDVQVHEDRLDEPAKNKKKWAGKKVFVCSMSDLFHEDVPFEFIHRVLIECFWSPAKCFQVLTKRPHRVIEYINWVWGADVTTSDKICFGGKIWIGTSCEDQATANERIPLLLKIPAAVRFLSCEPLLGPIDLSAYLSPLEGGKGGVDWVIAGGESGHGARPMHPAWVRSLRDQCANANVPFFFKQWGEYIPLSQSDDWRYKAIDFGYGVNRETMLKAGKSKSGNTLDGKQHLEFPKP